MQSKAERSLMKLQEKSAASAARKAEAEADTADAVRDATVQAKWAEADQRSSVAWGERLRAPAASEKDRRTTDLVGEQAITEQTLRDFRRGLIEQQTAAASASAGELNSRREYNRQRALQTERGQPEYLVGEEGGKIWRATDKGIETLGSGVGAVLRNLPRGRSIDFSAKQVGKRRPRPTPTSPVGKNAPKRKRR